MTAPDRLLAAVRGAAAGLPQLNISSDVSA